MSTPVLMPQLGMDMTEGRVARWLVADQTKVRRGEEILEIETDKVTHTVEAPLEGIVHQAAAEGAAVQVGGLLGHVLGPGESAPGQRSGIESGLAPAHDLPRSAPAQRPERAEIIASPIARRLAAQHKVDLASLVGSGPGGRIVEADVLAAVEAAQTQPHRTERKVLRRIPLTGRRKLIAERMMASLVSTAQLTVMREVEAATLVRARQALLDREKEIGVRVSYDALLAHALATAMVEQPALNAVIEGEEVIQLAEVHMGVAVAHQQGLIVPVVRNVEARSLLDISRVIDDMATRAAKNALLPDELAGGTVTITNLGMYGADAFTPILNPPQSAILGVGRIAPRPLVIGEDLVVQPSVVLSLTWDHRVADGSEAALLLGRVAELIKDEHFLLEHTEG
ncbi:MAG: dihydrolipoamide acetyltransferase family protein [Dehalococcoidales bacterium]|nr:dihydrolipoamide acetyltransferase family protein [Dehalococcoidales bacterium]